MNENRLRIRVGGLPVTIGTEHQTTTGTSQWSRFCCPHCRYERDVLLVGFGTGAGFDVLSLDPESAKRRAKSRAQIKAERACRQSIAVARCPHCRRTDTGARRRVYLSSVVLGLITGIGLACIGTVLVLATVHRDPMQETWVLPVMGVVGGVIAIGAIWRRIARRLAPPFFQPEDDRSLANVEPG
jgi:hypothetical protein